jgi:hypothetical protein
MCIWAWVKPILPAEHLQPLRKLFAVIVDPVLKVLAPVTYGAKVTVYPFHE